MVASLAHRGRDANGIYHDGEVLLGHTRLSIIDLDSGSQPMCDLDERYWVVFNGQIFNYRELGSELEWLGQKLFARYLLYLLQCGVHRVFREKVPLPSVTGVLSTASVPAER